MIVPRPILPFLFFLLFAQSIFAQTGPAGVGSSNTNVLWLKANKGTSSTTNNTPISSWNDQSGNSINVTQTISVQQPSFTTNVLNGQPAILFDDDAGTGPNKNDFMAAPDNPKLDNTPGYSFFTVTKMNAIGPDARCIVSKRTAIDIDEAFMLFYYTGNNFFLDIDGLGDRQSTTTTFNTGVGNIIDCIYDGSAASANRSKIYEGEILRKTFSETSTNVPDKPSPLNIGCTHVGNNRAFGGYMAEIVIYTVTVNDAQRIIINNYLSSKYDIALTANDKYVGDNPGNGNYDLEVAGIGNDGVGSNPTFSASVSGGIGLKSNSGLDAGDYIMAGHAFPANMAIATDVGGMTGINNARWLRIWYLDITNTSTAINTNVEFDMSDGGVGTVVPGTVSDYVLLYRPGQSGNWTELMTASSISGDRVLFNNINLSNDGYYTIGTRNYINSTLPVELLGFDAIMNGDKVDINWATATEKNNDYFTIERSKDGVLFEMLNTVDGAGNSTSERHYADTDYNPYSGISYYRLKQTDYNGSYTYSDMVAVNYTISDDGISIFPNPSNGEINLNLTGLDNKEVLVVIRDITGKECYSKVMLAIENKQLVVTGSENKLAPGAYIVVASSNNKLYSQKLLVK